MVLCIYSKFILYQRAQKTPHKEGFYDVIAHGAPTFVDFFGENIDGEERVVEGQLSLFEDFDEDLKNGKTEQVPIQKVFTLGE